MKALATAVTLFGAVIFSSTALAGFGYMQCTKKSTASQCQAEPKSLSMICCQVAQTDFSHAQAVWSVSGCGSEEQTAMGMLTGEASTACQEYSPGMYFYTRGSDINSQSMPTCYALEYCSYSDKPS